MKLNEAIEEMKKGKMVKRDNEVSRIKYKIDGSYIVHNFDDESVDWVRTSLMPMHFDYEWKVVEEKREKVLIGIDIITDCKIPKGTICYGHKDKNGIINIDRFGKFNFVEEKPRNLSEYIFKDSTGQHVISRRKVKVAIKKYIESIRERPNPSSMEQHIEDAKRIFGSELI